MKYINKIQILSLVLVLLFASIIYGAAKLGYFEAVCNHDTICSRVARDVCGETLWLSQPAERWLDAFPIGNGRLGAMVLGGTEIERLALNHENLWRGVTRDRTTQPRHQHLAEIRERFFAREWIKGTELAVKAFCDWPYPVSSGVDLFHNTGGLKHVEKLAQPYQAFGDMTLELGHAEVSDYHRSLALNTGITEVCYEADGISY